jgi:hypothetical protein
VFEREHDPFFSRRQRRRDGAVFAAVLDDARRQRRALAADAQKHHRRCRVGRLAVAMVVDEVPLRPRAEVAGVEMVQALSIEPSLARSR